MFVFLLFCTISQKPTQIGSPNFTHTKCSTMSLGKHFILGSRSRVRKELQRRSVPCECWLLVVAVINTFWTTNWTVIIFLVHQLTHLLTSSTPVVQRHSSNAHIKETTKFIGHRVIQSAQQINKWVWTLADVEQLFFVYETYNRKTILRTRFQRKATSICDLLVTIALNADSRSNVRLVWPSH